MGFLDKISEVELESGLTPAQYEAKLKAILITHLKLRLKLLRDTGKKLDVVIQKACNPHAATAAIPPFSDYEEEIDFIVDQWVAGDEALRKRLRRHFRLYLKKLKTKNITVLIHTVLAEHHAVVQEHVAEANKYGAEWTTHAVIKKNKTKNTITWFTNLTVEEVKNDYVRDLQKAAER